MCWDIWSNFGSCMCSAMYVGIYCAQNCPNRCSNILYGNSMSSDVVSGILSGKAGICSDILTAASSSLLANLLAV